MAASLKFYWNTAVLIHLVLSVAALHWQSPESRDCKARKTKNIYYLTLSRKSLLTPGLGRGCTMKRN